MDAGILSAEITWLAWSVILLLAHIFAQAMSLSNDNGVSYNAGARDKPVRTSAMTERLTRALRNFLETYAAFVALALALQVTGKSGGLGATGAAIWFCARVAYLPAYAFGVPYLRSVIWSVSLFGLLLMLYRLLE
ncbi:MAG: MAPEG family protein [Rhizobiaceae bacterium]|nr:MAPEG family protein [Rhizobiaceae bacterium]